MLLSRLLACLALFTGLAAAGAPVEAVAVDMVGAQLEADADSDQDGEAGNCACREQQRKARARGKQVRPCAQQRRIRVYIPTVQFGPDRAIE